MQRDAILVDQRLQLFLQALLRAANLQPQAAQRRAGGVQNLTLVADALFDARRQLRTLGQVAPQRLEQRKIAIHALKQARHIDSAVDGTEYLQQLGRLEHRFALGAHHQRANVAGAAHASVGANIEQALRLSSVGQPLLHFAQVGGRLERQGQLFAGRKGGLVSQALQNLGIF